MIQTVRWPTGSVARSLRVRLLSLSVTPVMASGFTLKPAWREGAAEVRRNRCRGAAAAGQARVVHVFSVNVWKVYQYRLHVEDA